MNTNLKRVLIAAAVYGVTMCVSIFVIMVAAAMISMLSYNCGEISRGLPRLLITIALVYIASFVMVVVVTGKYTPGKVGRILVLAAYGVLITVSYVFVAFGLVVLSNC